MPSKEKGIGLLSKSVERAVDFIFEPVDDIYEALDDLHEEDEWAAELQSMTQAFISGMVCAGVRDISELKVNARLYAARLLTYLQEERQ